ncbi:MAG: ABC transporter ATP-binding protein [Candidatus Hydromicrobium americanum]|nr:MAG: ABC transporter ATP-binding protein [Candidatus Hydromicrobium americanum]
MSDNNNIIIAKDLSKKYNEHLVVDNLNLAIKKGEIFGLLGPNGAGKSTVILMALGLTEPSSGSINVAGFNSTREPLKVKRITGYLPEKVGFYDDMTAKSNLTYTAELNNIPYRETPKKIDEVLEIVELTKNKNQLVKTFSKGMKQRLGIADVLIKDPQLVIFDEPTEGLDLKVANQILQTILNLNKQKNITFLLSSHQLNLMQRVCPRVGILSKGKLIGEGNVENLGRNLFGGGKYRIELELEKVTDEIIEKLKKLDKVVNVNKVDNQLQVVCDKDIRQDISRLITDEGILMTRMNMKKDALEEIYLKYFKEE